MSLLEGVDGREVVGGEGFESDCVDGGFVKLVVEVSSGESGGEELEDGFPVKVGEKEVRSRLERVEVEKAGRGKNRDSLVSLEALGSEEAVLSGESGRESSTDVLSFSDGSESRGVGVALEV